MADRCREHPWGTCGRCGRDLGNEASDLHHGDLGLVCRPCYLRLNIKVMKLPIFRAGVRGQKGGWFWVELKGPGQIPTRHGPFKTKEAAETASTLTWRWVMLDLGLHNVQWRWRRHLFANGNTTTPVCGSAISSSTSTDAPVNPQDKRLADCRRCRNRAR